MKRILVIVLVGAILLAGCSTLLKAAAPAMSGSVYSDVQNAPGLGGGAPYAQEARAPAMEMPSLPTAMPQSDYTQGNTAGTPGGERLVIQNADLMIVVADPVTKMDSIAKMAQQMGGFVVSSNLYETTLPNGIQVPETNITIRVPAEKMNDALTQIKAEVLDITSETRTGQDVTQEYTDLQSRLRNYEAAEAQLREIMASATKTEDVLNVFNQITYYREQIEVIKGQMQYYEQSAALSAINVRILAEETVQPLEIGGWKPVGVARNAVQALINFFKGFVNFLIWLVVFIVPVVAVIILPIWGIWCGIRNWRAKRKVRKTQPTK